MTVHETSKQKETRREEIKHRMDCVSVRAVSFLAWPQTSTPSGAAATLRQAKTYSLQFRAGQCDVVPKYVAMLADATKADPENADLWNVLGFAYLNQAAGTMLTGSKPTPGPNEILAKGHAAALNPVHWHFVRGAPFPVRIAAGGLRRPRRHRRVGCDYSGTIEAVGPGVSGFTAGEPVFGIGDGSLAEYLTAPADRAARKPERLTFERAAAVPLAGLSALQMLRDKALVRSGYHILIVGAAGGIGTFAVQLAREFGADVTKLFGTKPNRADLQVLAGLIQAGTVTPVIDRCYPLTAAAEAFRHLESGHAHGKIVVTTAARP